MEVKIEKLDNLGRGITYINGKICFVDKALPEEIVQIKIVKEKTKYMEAEVLEYLKKSPLRIKEECPYSSVCGGCSLNHISYEEENKFKNNKVKEIIEKYADVSSSAIRDIKYHERNHYRNKLILHGNGENIGLYQKKTNDIVPIKECLLVSNKINETVKILNNYAKEIKEAIIKVDNIDTKVMVSIEGNIKNVEEIKDKCDVLIVNGFYQTKDKELLTNIGSKKYLEGINSFFQVNQSLTKELYNEVKDSVDGNNKKVLDLYCGTGTIGIYIYRDGMNIIGIDNNKSNIDDAERNKKLNKVKDINFICDKVENVIEQFQNIDLIIVDPPRKGLDQKTIEYIKVINPKKVIYVSCDVITLARDLKLLKDNYNIKYVQPFNMFPRTMHCESIAVLERKN